MIAIETNPYLAALNCAYTMLGYRDGYSGKLGTLETPKSGFMVAIRTIATYNSLIDVSVWEMVEVLEEAVKELAIQDLYIGAFKDPDTNVIYFELSVNLLDFDTAIEWGKKNSQKYIYDVTNDCNILVNE